MCCIRTEQLRAEEQDKALLIDEMTPHGLEKLAVPPIQILEARLCVN